MWLQGEAPRLVGSGPPGSQELCSGCMLFDASWSCQGKYQTGMSRVTLVPLSFCTRGTSQPLRPAAARWLVLIEITVRYEAATRAQLFLPWGSRAAHRFLRFCREHPGTVIPPEEELLETECCVFVVVLSLRAVLLTPVVFMVPSAASVDQLMS